MKRREFLMSSAAVVAGHMFESALGGQTGTGRTYQVLGVPLRAGSLLPGNENDAQAYRDAGLIEHLRTAGCKAVDAGDVAIPSYLPHHSIPPIRSWPAPRIAWECVGERIAPILQQPGQVPLLIGCDCSVVLGTAGALMRDSSRELHVLYVDGDFDDAPPEAARCQSAASCAVWLLTNASPFWVGPALEPSKVSVIGWSNASKSGKSGLGSVSLAEVRRAGAREAAHKVLESFAASAQLLLHFDIDVLRKADLAAAYFPHAEGMTLSEAGQLLGVLMKDPRVRVIEVSEYATLRDLDQSNVAKLVDLLAKGLAE